MKDGFVYPNGSRKAITFTIDDGNVPMDRRFLEIVKPHGILGTFNLCSHILGHLTPEEYVEFYRGYEIANHSKAHPSLLRDADRRPVAEEKFDSKTADVSKMYPNPLFEGTYYYHFERGWRLVASEDAYCRLVRECTPELEAVFGKGSVRSFVWPNGDQKNEKIHEYIKSLGFYGIRKTGNVGDTTGFALPSDRFAWSYNADHRTLLDTALKFEQAEDDGELKFFSFGVHSVDFERAGNWRDLEEFAKKYGDRPDEYYYATVGDIFDYEDATRLCTVTEEGVTNLAETDVYYQREGVRYKIPSGARIQF